MSFNIISFEIHNIKTHGVLYDNTVEFHIADGKLMFYKNSFVGSNSFVPITDYIVRFLMGLEVMSKFKYKERRSVSRKIAKIFYNMVKTNHYISEVPEREKLNPYETLEDFYIRDSDYEHMEKKIDKLHGMIAQSPFARRMIDVCDIFYNFSMSTYIIPEYNTDWLNIVSEIRVFWNLHGIFKPRISPEEVVKIFVERYPITSMAYIQTPN